MAKASHALFSLAQSVKEQGVAMDRPWTFRKAKTSPGDFKFTTPKNPLINNQAVTNIRNFTITSAYPKNQSTVEPLLHYQIGLDLVVAFLLLMLKSPICV